MVAVSTDKARSKKQIGDDQNENAKVCDAILAATYSEIYLHDQTDKTNNVRSREKNKIDGDDRQVM